MEVQGRAFIRGAVMDDNVFPFSARVKGDDGLGGTGLGDNQLLAHVKGVAVHKAIGVHDRCDGDIVHFADTP